jgi:hypothetical protein
LKPPPGAGLLLIGSGLYWVLSGPLIGWFSVLDPWQIHLSQLGLTLLLAAGITCLTTGFWIIQKDFQELSILLSRHDGWFFVMPIMLVVADVYLTLYGISQGAWELNPFVSSAVRIGPWAIIPFVVSYLALSEGLALVMLSLGKWLFGGLRPLRFMPFALTCGAASFGPVSNAELLALSGLGPGIYSTGMIVAVVSISIGIYTHFSRTMRGRLAMSFS